ncbi:TPA: Bro-N domain-containing protein [Salmonella enterica]
MSGILYEGKPAFDAVELAKSLGYTNPAKALKDHCKALIKLDYNESLKLGFRKHNRVVDAALLCTPGIVASRSGMFFMRTVLSGKSRDMLRANKTVQREAGR